MADRDHTSTSGTPIEALHSALGGGMLRDEAISVVVWDADLVCRAANPAAAAIMGRDPDEIVGATVEENIPGVASHLREIVAGVLATGATHSEVALVLATPDGVRQERVFSAIPVQLGAERLVAALSMDVTSEQSIELAGVQRLDAEADRARAARAEYNRALLDYTQLVRHRIANPLTSVLGGLRTLLDLELAPEVRRELLESMLASAERLEHVTLHPDPMGPEETGLDAAPSRRLAGESVEHAVEVAAGDVEADFRDLNRHTIESAEREGVARPAFACECSTVTCAAPIDLTPEQYERAHQDAACFVILPGHEVGAVEDVVLRTADWLVVRKRGAAAVRARAR